MQSRQYFFILFFFSIASKFQTFVESRELRAGIDNRPLMLQIIKRFEHRTMLTILIYTYFLLLKIRKKDCGQSDFYLGSWKEAHILICWTLICDFLIYSCIPCQGSDSLFGCKGRWFAKHSVMFSDSFSNHAWLEDMWISNYWRHRTTLSQYSCEVSRPVAWRNLLLLFPI